MVKLEIQLFNKSAKKTKALAGNNSKLSTSTYNTSKETN
jgi:hypothetical protein